MSCCFFLLSQIVPWTSIAVTHAPDLHHHIVVTCGDLGVSDGHGASCLVVMLSLRTSIAVTCAPDLHHHIVVAHGHLGWLDGHGTGCHQIIAVMQSCHIDITGTLCHF